MLIEDLVEDIQLYDWKAAYLHGLGRVHNKYYSYFQYIISKNQQLDMEGRKQFLNHKYKKAKNETINWENPQTFDEKINWLMLYDASPLKKKLVDKYEVRSYIEEKIGSDYLIPLINVWDDVSSIHFDTLPDQFVLKLNNGCGMNLLVRDKSKLNFDKVKKELEEWMKIDFAYLNLEMQYEGIKPKIIAEEFIEQLDGDLYDYKIHCFNGIPTFCQLIGSRNAQDQSGKQAFYDMDWNRLPFSLGKYEPFSQEIEKPVHWEKMVEIASKLAESFPYVRVDLYNINGKILFGELTFTPAHGVHSNFTPKSEDYRLGQMIHLPVNCQK